MKRNKAKDRVFKFNQDLDKSYRLLFGPTNRAGCTICGEDEPELLDIHEADDSNGFKVLCSSCRGKIVMNNCNLPAKNNITRGVTQ